MKDTFGFPKTLRNYPEQPTKPNTFLSPSNNIKSYKSLSSYNSKKTIEQEHNVDNVGDYYFLTNPSLVKSKENKTKKNKKKSKSKQSHLSQALRQQLNKPIISYSQIGPQNILHCKSLEKLQIISNDRSEQIKALMNEKGFLIAQNQDLRAKLANPTYREQDYVQKIAQRQFEIQNLKQALKRKQEVIYEIEKDYKLQIERLKVKHRQQIASLREEMNKIRLEKLSDSPKKYVKTTNYTTSNQKTYKPQQRTYKPQKTYNSYNPVIQTKPSYSNTVNSNIYRISQQNESSNPPVQVHSLNYGNNYNSSTSNNFTSKSLQRVHSDNSEKPYTTYIGEDGYERRVYNNQNSESLENARNSTKISDNRNIIISPTTNTQTIRYSSAVSNNQQYSGSPFTNEKITTYVSKQPSATNNLYKYSETSYGKQSQGENSSSKYESGQHNQNLYSKSLTFQCFNDFN